MAEFEEHICPACGIVYGLTARFVAGRRQNKETFYCPNGHSLSFKKSKEDQLAEELSRVKQQLAQRDDVINSLSNSIDRERQDHAVTKKQAAAYKGKVGTLARRAAAGICPCCSRSFVNMARHMADKHPNFVAEEVA